MVSGWKWLTNDEFYPFHWTMSATFWAVALYAGLNLISALSEIPALLGSFCKNLTEVSSVDLNNTFHCRTAVKALCWMASKSLNVKTWCISYDYHAVGSGNFQLGSLKHNKQFYIITFFELVTMPENVKQMNYKPKNNSPDTWKNYSSVWGKAKAEPGASSLKEMS